MLAASAQHILVAKRRCVINCSWTSGTLSKPSSQTGHKQLQRGSCLLQRNTAQSLVIAWVQLLSLGFRLSGGHENHHSPAACQYRTVNFLASTSNTRPIRLSLRPRSFSFLTPRAAVQLVIPDEQDRVFLQGRWRQLREPCGRVGSWVHFLEIGADGEPHVGVGFWFPCRNEGLGSGARVFVSNYLANIQSRFKVQLKAPSQLGL